MGSAYGMWTFGVQKGRIEIMSIMSYFTPVLSCIFASLLIGAKLTHESGLAFLLLCSARLSVGRYQRKNSFIELGSQKKIHVRRIFLRRRIKK